MNTLKSIGRRLGLDITRTLSQRTLETHLPPILRDYQIDCVLDVGANNGQYGRLLRSIGYRGQIISFEPLPSAFLILREAASNDPHWEVVNQAVSDTTGTTQIIEYASSVFSSILRPNDVGQSLFADLREVTSHPAKLTTLDGFCAQHDLFNRKLFLKTDTQGFELKVLAGAKAILPSVCALQAEVNFLPIYEGMPDFTSIYHAARSSGFELSGLFPVSRSPSHSLIEADMVMCRRHPATQLEPSSTKVL